MMMMIALPDISNPELFSEREKKGQSVNLERYYRIANTCGRETWFRRCVKAIK